MAWKDKEAARSYQREWYKKNRERVCAQSKAWHQNNKARSDFKSRDRHMRRRYGIGVAEFDAMKLAQNYTCAICPTQDWEIPQGLCVDHNHNTGQVRGLLCPPCNMALGLLRDDASLVSAAEKYLLDPPHKSE